MFRNKFPASSTELLNEIELVDNELSVVNNQIKTVKKDLDASTGTRQEDRFKEQFRYLIKSKAKLIDQKQFWSELEERKRLETTENNIRKITTVVSLDKKIICEKRYFVLEDSRDTKNPWRELKIKSKNISRKEKLLTKSSSDLSETSETSIIDIRSSESSDSSVKNRTEDEFTESEYSVEESVQHFTETESSQSSISSFESQ